MTLFSYQYVKRRGYYTEAPNPFKYTYTKTNNGYSRTTLELIPNVTKVVFTGSLEELGDAGARVGDIYIFRRMGKDTLGRRFDRFSLEKEIWNEVSLVEGEYEIL